MPEGDTIYRTAAMLATALTGGVLTRGELRHPRLATVDLVGREVLGARPVGKHLFLRFSGNLSFRSHLAMDGVWQVSPTTARWRRPEHQARAVLHTADTRAIGFLLQEMDLVETTDEHRLVAHLGPDLLDPDWGPAHAAEALARLTADPAREIGLVLLDQRVMAGIGNVFKAEICFVLGVSPWTPVSDVDTERAVAVSRDLLERNKMNVDRHTTGDPRRDRRLWVYGHRTTPCLVCGGKVIATTQGSDTRERVAYYCPHCQPGPVG
ncbi:Fpg/Nei family DNA glycosylase [Actinokineospora globicatena]|uniref:Fpg/Nei family DNA glycosylase n=1 Tax=Actinokineospora globicatena TaxID=103729 RepID=UPI0020A3AC31|nr:DNA-formamidopyrimidine glycosylase family protein [Actinokineospora globicatena]MCP2304302.1 endonuclease-8 [Actinokineospora globicatena]GLW78336.1 endonuclease VIII [Actinokineospora globicatena]GLW85000.1 endonuclease VIII [Actinokineospora globicatena]